MDKTKKMMLDVATLYYKENMTQQKIAETLNITRQTVSKLLKNAVDEKVVEIRINAPDETVRRLEKAISDKFGIAEVVVGSAASDGDLLRKAATVRAASAYLTPIICGGNKKIGVAWGKTVEEVIAEIPETITANNVVFPLLGATMKDTSCYYANKLAEDLAKKVGAAVNYAYFPYVVSAEDAKLIKQTSFYKEIETLWKNTDLAVVGIGNLDAVNTVRKLFGKTKLASDICGDIATHIFDENGEFISLGENTLCASRQDVVSAKKTVAVAYGKRKCAAIKAAMKTGAVNVLITDEYTAAEILA